MTDESPDASARRAELDQAFQHLIDLAATVPLPQDASPQEAWLAQLRTTVPAYGGAYSDIDLSGVTFTPVSADGVRAQWVTAEGVDATRRIVYFHGGAWAAGSPFDSHKTFSATLARQSRAAILMVDYRLSPEHRYPAGLDDCVKAYEWALVNGPTTQKAGQDPVARISVGGDSAGGNLAAATCVRLATTGRRMPDRLALIAATLDQVSMWDRVGVDDLICTNESLSFSVHYYLPPGVSPADPEVSPAFAPAEVLAKFPPTLLQVSAIEALVFDSKRMADRLEKAGVRLKLSLWPALPHVWHAFLNLFPEAQEAIGEIADFTNR